MTEPTEVVLTRLGERVRALRRLNNLTQEQLAERVGLSRTSITNVEAGRQGDIGVMNLIALADALHTSLADLTGTAPTTVDRSAWLDLARQITASERTYQQLADECWTTHDVIAAVRWRGIAEGLRIARDHQADVVAEVKNGGRQP
jgi:transcriptional regulator with XRE-family HTH domain